jgi:hypothetical protein
MAKKKKTNEMEGVEKKPKGKSRPPSTQRYLDILEIRDDVVVMKDGGLRAVLLVSSMNFSLKSEDEQKAVVQGYVNFLNSLNFMIQIVIQSRRLDVGDYLDRLKTVERAQTNELLKMQTMEYRRFVEELVDLGEIMSKHFYVVIQYAPMRGRQKSFLQRLGEVLSPAAAIRLSKEKSEKYGEELQRRVDFVTEGLESLGLNSARLQTQALIELYYNSYNPIISENEPLEEINQLRIEGN